MVQQGTPILGTLALPAHGERYITREGNAYLNGAQIHTAATVDLREAVVSTGNFATGPESEKRNTRRLAMIGRLASSVGRVRMLGSAATDLAWLAAGRLDAVVIDANRPWDVAAGIALARAAGAEITHIDGSPYTLGGRDLLEATPHVHAAVVSMLSNAL